MTGTNSSNDRLILRQNVEMNSNEYFSAHDIFFQGWNRLPGNGIVQSPRKMSYSLELFQWFIIVYQTIIIVIFHLSIICYDWWCHFPFFLISVITEAVFFGEMCLNASLVAQMVNTNLEAQKLWLRQHWPFVSIRSFEQTQQVGRVTR